MAKIVTEYPNGHPGMRAACVACGRYIGPCTETASGIHRVVVGADDVQDYRDAHRYQLGQHYAADSIARRGLDEMLRAIRIRFCSPGDYHDASDYDRGVVDETLDAVQA